jgi:hypothetical protein
VPVEKVKFVTLRVLNFAREDLPVIRAVALRAFDNGKNDFRPIACQLTG